MLLDSTATALPEPALCGQGAYRAAGRQGRNQREGYQAGSSRALPLPAQHPPGTDPVLLHSCRNRPGSPPLMHRGPWMSPRGGIRQQKNAQTGKEAHREQHPPQRLWLHRGQEVGLVLVVVHPSQQLHLPAPCPAGCRSSSRRCRGQVAQPRVVACDAGRGAGRGGVCRPGWDARRPCTLELAAQDPPPTALSVRAGAQQAVLELCARESLLLHACAR